MPAPEPIDRDLACPTCDYNLRGLKFWPLAGAGHVTVSGYLGEEILGRAIFGPTGRFDEAETYMLLLPALFHLWLLCVLLATLAALRRAAAPGLRPPVFVEGE